MKPVVQRCNIGGRLTVLGLGHLGILAVMFVLLETYEPEPSGFRFDTVGKVGGFAMLTAAPILIGLGARRLTSAAFVGLLQTLSPLLLVGTMRDPTSDLNFAILLWWFPVPAVAAVVVIIDRLVGPVER